MIDIETMDKVELIRWHKLAFPHEGHKSAFAKKLLEQKQLVPGFCSRCGCDLPFEMTADSYPLCDDCWED